MRRSGSHDVPLSYNLWRSWWRPDRAIEHHPSHLAFIRNYIEVHGATFNSKPIAAWFTTCVRNSLTGGRTHAGQRFWRVHQLNLVARNFPGPIESWFARPINGERAIAGKLGE